MKEIDAILQNQSEFLKSLKSKFTLIHMSNVFFRDFHYGVLWYLGEHGMKTTYAKAEKIAREVGNALEERGIFRKIDHQSWRLNYPEYALPRTEKKAS